MNPTNDEQRTDWKLVSAGFALLTVASYYDTIRGPILPVIMSDLSLDFSQNGWFLTVGQLSGVVAVSCMGPLIRRVGERRTVFAVCALSGVSALCSILVFNYASLMLLAAGVGASISTMGALCNLLVVVGSSNSQRSRLLAGLHSMYGYGSMSASAIVAAGLKVGVTWKNLFLWSTPILLLLTVYSFFTVRNVSGEAGKSEQKIRAPIRPIHALGVAVICFYVAGEVSATLWLPTFLTNVVKLNPSDAAETSTYFFLVMAGARTLCFLVPLHGRDRTVIQLALIAPAIAFLIGYVFHIPAAFALVGLVGPFFPLLLGRMGRVFPESIRSITLWIMSLMQLTLAFTNLGLGKAADRIGLGTAYLLPLVLFAVSLALLRLYFRFEGAEVQNVKSKP